MASEITLPAGQNWLIYRMQQLSNHQFVSSGGVCYGLAQTVMLDHLSGEDVKELNEILFAIHDIPINEFKNVVDSIHQKYIQIVRDAELYATHKLNSYKKDIDYHAKLSALMRVCIDKAVNSLTKQEQTQLKIRALLESFQILQQSLNYKDLFGGHVIDQFDPQSLAIISSNKLKAKGGVATAAVFSGIYEINALTIFLEELKKTFLTQRINFPISFGLTNLTHHIVINFQPGVGMLFVDSKNLPIQIINDPKTLAKKIMSTFLGVRATAFATRVYVSSDHLDTCNEELKNLKRSHVWENIHAVSSARANKTDDIGATALMMAAACGDETNLNTLLKHGANPNKVTICGLTSLFLAINNRQVNVVKKLLQYDINIDPIYQGQTALRHATLLNEYKIVKLLLERGANPNISEQWTDLPLMIAVINKNIDILKCLIDKGASLLQPGILALYFSAQLGYVDFVKELIERGVNINGKVNGRTALEKACANNHAAIVNLLLLKGANPNLTNELGRSPLMIAVQNKHAGIIEDLIFHHADVNVVSADGMTALLIAANNGQAEIVKKLLEEGADIQAKINGKTARELAAKNGHDDVVVEIDNALKLKNAQSFNLQSKINTNNFIPLFKSPARENITEKEENEMKVKAPR